MAAKSGSTGWRTIPELLIACAGHRPGATVMIDATGVSLSAAQLLDRTRRAACFLDGNGIRRGDFVAVDVTSLSWAQGAVAFFGVTWLGAAAVLTMGDAAARVADEVIGAVASITADAGSAAPAGPAGPAGSASSASSASSANSAGSAGSARAAIRFTPADLASGADRSETPAAQPDDRLDLVFTSGTTGVPKPVASTHAQWTRSVRPEMMASRNQRTVGHTGVPIGVSGGLHGVLLNHLARGVTSVQAGTAAGLIEACPRHGVSELHMTPHSARGVVRQLTSQHPQPWAQLIRVIRVVGGPVPAAVADGLTQCFPRARVVSLYGLTEGGAALCVKRLGGQAHDSIGRPAPGTEVCVLDPDGRELPSGQVGELAVRSTGTGALSYYREDSLNSEWFAESWARTGDMGYVDSGGTIRLVGRGKELIFLRGGRVSPETIEEILSPVLPPAVEFAVAGVRSDGGWDRIAVFLAGAVDDPRLAEARRRLAAMKGPFRPDLVRVTSQIPRGPFGKPMRRLLVAEAAADDS